MMEKMVSNIAIKKNNLIRILNDNDNIKIYYEIKPIFEKYEVVPRRIEYTGLFSLRNKSLFRESTYIEYVYT